MPVMGRGRRPRTRDLLISSVTIVALSLLAVPTLGASPPEPMSADLDLFMHFVPGTAASLPPEVRKDLTAAFADFRAVLAGRSPVHATVDQTQPVPADGGTTFWLGSGYQLTVVKSLNSVAGVDGYMYGPVVTFASKLGNGNSPSISQISFYPSQALRDLLREH
jgi:hypothetical protein